MREIKFRGKTKDGEWVKGYFIEDTEFYGKPNHHSYIVDHKHPSGCFGSDIYKEVIPETIGQYTGLKDKNGVEIYEGDIVKAKYHELRDFGDEIDDDYTETVEEVIWLPMHNGFGLKIMIEDIPLYRPLDFVTKVNGIKLIELEVIGNIYENPELLKEVKE